MRSIPAAVASRGRSLRTAVALVVAALAVRTAGTAHTAEPNQTFATSTRLPAGTLLVTDLLTPGSFNFPDTLLGLRDLGGGVTRTDDDGSLLGNGKASGFADVPLSDGEISLVVSGAGDGAFAGAHAATGDFEIIVDVFDAEGTLVASLDDVRTLQPGSVQEFLWDASAEWTGGSFDVNIDNAIGEPAGGDVDFFTFTGLTPGAAFTVQTLAAPSPVNTFLYWFNAAGAVVDVDDNSGAGQLSLIAGVVPAGGELTFAVTGFGDLEEGLPAGAHRISGAYQLALESTSASLAADFDHDLTVDGDDLPLWIGAFGAGAAGDASGDGASDGIDVLIWQRQLGQTLVQAGESVTSLPEPALAAAWLLACVPLGRATRIAGGLRRLARPSSSAVRL